MFASPQEVWIPVENGFQPLAVLISPKDEQEKRESHHSLILYCEPFSFVWSNDSLM